MKIMWILLFGIGVPLVIISLFGYYLTWQVQTDPRQAAFAKGTIPSPLPDGFYSGSVGGMKVAWKGKKFDRQYNTGINILGGNKEEKFPFVTHVGRGLTDKKTDVLKIDYNILKNPFWLRVILDEIVEVEPGKYLGKVHILLFPHFPFTLGYFVLQK